MRDTQSGIKSEMKESIDKSIAGKELQKISLDDNAGKISWEDRDKNEFSFNGEMYDVVKMVKENGKTTIYCINDKKEQSLVDEYNKATKDNSSHGKKLNTENSITLFVYEKNEQVEKPNGCSKKYPAITNNFVSVPSEIVSPPPKS